MKSYIYKILIFMGIMLGFQENVHAYITVASTSYSLEVGIDKYLSVPNAYDGYIDHAVWACSNSAISFKEKDAAGAIIQITRAYSETAIIELLATEKYLDSYGRTRGRTYYKQYLITCIGGGSGPSTGDSEIIIPENISLNLGETKQFNILSGNCYNGAFTLTWKKWSPERFAMYSVNYDTGAIEISGAMSGEGILNVKTAAGDERDCNIVVASPEIVSNRRTEKVAVLDIKSLIANILPIAKTSGIEDVLVDFDEKRIQRPNHIYNLQGILLKENATLEDIQSLAPGFYIVGGKKIIVR